MVGPAIESLKYTFDTKELREMYLNLLASSMNVEKIESTHPAYVQIIKQMSPLDAKIFKIIASKKTHRLPSANITIGFDDRYYPDAMPNKFVPDLVEEDIDPFLVSTSIDNLCRLGLLLYRENVSIAGYDYNVLKENDYVVERLNLYNRARPENKNTIKLIEAVVITTDFGNEFIKVCL